MLNKGDDAPDFTLRDQSGKEHTRSQYRGKKPRDFMAEFSPEQIKRLVPGEYRGEVLGSHNPAEK